MDRSGSARQLIAIGFAVPNGRRLREHGLLSLFFLASRLLLDLSGLRFNFIIDWMFLADPADLEHRLMETVLHFHAYPPGMNLLTGALFKLAGDHSAMLAHALFGALSLILVNAVLTLMRVAGLSIRLALPVAFGFAVLPQTLYFEHLYLYTLPTAALLSVAAVLFHRALSRPTSAAWCGFFLACCAIGWVRSTFHLAWFVAMGGLSLAFALPADRRLVWKGMATPAAILLALYLKNWVLFDVFASASSLGGNLTHITISRLPREVRAEWIAEGKLSGFAALSGYAGPREYRRFFPSTRSERWPTLGALERPTVRAPNFNHWFFLEVDEHRKTDALYYVRHRPLDYAASVARNVVQLLGPTTRWHPHDATPRSPHHQHRQVLGWYENTFNGVVHELLLVPVGLYALLPVALIVAIRRAWRLLAGGGPGARPLAGLIGFAVFQVVFVILVSALVNYGEAARYRFQIEAIIWLVGASAVLELRRRATPALS